MSSHRVALAAIALAAIIWLPRYLVLDRVVTPDEPSWLTNSANFYDALSNGDFGETYRIEHPGVTIMWLGTLAYLWTYPEYVDDATEYYPWWDAWRLEEIAEESGHDPLDILIVARYLVITLFTLTMVAAFASAVRLVGLAVAGLGFLLIAFDPLFLGLSGLLHLDALVSAFMLLSLLAFLNYLHDGRRRDLVLSSLALGLAVLTKTPALFLPPFCFLLAASRGVKRVEERWVLDRLALHEGLRRFAFWSALGFGVFILLWPAMWTDPLDTALDIVRGSAGHAANGHESPLFFNGTVYEGDPGPHYYPLAYLWRATPIVLAGLAFFAVSLVVNRRRSERPLETRAAVVLVLFSIGFLVFMTFGAKKFDRYLLPIFGPLDIVAAVGWVAAGRWLRQQWRLLARAALPAVLGVALLLQAAGALRAYPYYFSYYNPLLGGASGATGTMMIGWGEGLDRAGDYLNRQPNAAELLVATSAWSGTLSYFVDGQMVGDHYAVDDADYYVLYYNQLQRRAVPDEFQRYLATREIVFTVNLDGVDYVRIYDLHSRSETSGARGPGNGAASTLATASGSADTMSMRR